MADEEIPENVNLRFLAAQNAGILHELAALSGDLKATKAEVEDISERLQTVEGQAGPDRKAHRACEAIHTRYSATIDEAIAKVKASRGLEKVRAFDGAVVYAYPHGEGIAWGVNAHESGLNILRGTRRPDGVDEADT